eukprot:g530.t1
MPLEFCNEVMEIITMAVDKYSAQSNYEAACQLIKTQLDKKYGAAWHCCIGEGLAFEITYQQKNMMHLYYGKVGVIAYKC